jgi:lipase
MTSFEIYGVKIAFADVGKGPPVVLAHCSSASHRMWSALMRQLAPTNRVLAPDLIGYGQSGRWPEGRPYQADGDIRVLVELARRAGEPVHFVGHSYGAAMALEAARLIGNMRGLTLIEPVSFHLLKAGGFEAEHRVVKDVSDRCNQAVALGDRRRASAAYMGFWLGRFRWWLAPAKLKGPVMETVDKVAMEFAAIESQTVDSLAPYQTISAPTLLIYGAKTRAPAKAAVRILEGTLPRVRTAEIAGAGHMSPLTHRERVNTLVVEHIREVERASAATVAAE